MTLYALMLSQKTQNHTTNKHIKEKLLCVPFTVICRKMFLNYETTKHRT